MVEQDEKGMHMQINTQALGLLHHSSYFLSSNAIEMPPNNSIAIKDLNIKFIRLGIFPFTSY